MRPWIRLVLHRCRGMQRRTEGVAAVEFALMGLVFLMIVGGVMDLGHAWYLKQVVTNASREGARFGTYTWQTATMDHIKPCDLGSHTPPGQTISQYVQQNLNGTGITATVTADGPDSPGYTSGLSGDDLQVKVSTTKNWWFLGCILGSSSTTISATTTLRLP